MHGNWHFAFVVKEAQFRSPTVHAYNVRLLAALVSSSASGITYSSRLIAHGTLARAHLYKGNQCYTNFITSARNYIVGSTMFAKVRLTFSHHHLLFSSKDITF